ncbi:PAS domain-containing protein [Methanolobus profundi]|uniref:histidine kinase n=1 Tax=Methanolobus profundi TaxID=487685 RepID=A0A1I4PEU8_9EURY|nr:PAS domain S-box protein [Methanolobus profundi]SFM26269.1 PAS domain S-box-containing protein [Methanolobus profundi]
MVFIDEQQLHTGNIDPICEEDEELIGYFLTREGTCKGLFEDEVAVVLLVDPRTLDIIDANNTACSFYGWKRSDVHSKNIRDLAVLSDKYEKCHENIDIAGRGRYSISRHNAANGTFRDVKIYMSPVLGEQDRQYYMIQDITEHKILEEKRHITNFSLFNFSDAVFCTGSNGQFFYVNYAACTHLGYSEDELLTMGVADINPNFTFNKWKRHWEKVKSEKNFMFQTLHRTKKGVIIPVEITVNYMIYDGKEYNCAIVKDISERKRTEKGLKLACFSLENFSDAVIWSREDGSIFYVNKAVCDILDYSSDDLLSMSIPDINPMFTTESWREHWKEVQMNKEFHLDTTLYTSSGKPVPVEITANYMNYEGKEYNYAIIKDVTERKRAEKKLQMACFSVENFVDPVAWIKNDGKFIYVNQAACDLLGYTKKEFQSMSVFDIAPYYTQEIWDHRWIEIKRKKRDRIESYFSTRSGENIPVSISSTYMNYEGKEYICSFALDITEKKKAEDDLKLASFSLENSGDAVFWLEKNGQIFYANRAARKLLNYNDQELLTMSVPDINPFLSHDMWTEHWNKLKEGKVFHIETSLRTRSGDMCPVEITSGYLNWEGKEYDCAFVRDLTERKNSEKELLESKGQLRTLVDTIPDLVWLKDLNGFYLACNTRFEQLYGAKEAEIIGRSDHDFVEKETADLFRGTDRKAIDAGTHIVFEEEVTYADGHKEYLETIKSPVYDANGKLIGVLGVGRDITQRKRSEEQLKKASFSLEKSSDAVIWINKSGKIDYVNKAACDLIGYSEDEFLSMMIFETNPTITPEDWEKHWTNIENEKVIDTETFVPTRSGKMCPVEITISYMNYEGKEYDCAIIRDLTERKKYERTLEQEVKGRRNLMDRSKDGIVSLDMDGKVFEANPAYARMLGYTMEEIKDLYVWDWDVNYTKDQLLNMIRNNDETGLFLETKQRCKDGRVLDVDLNSNSVEFADQRLVFCVCRDVTDRKKEINELLEAKLIAETASKIKDEFLATMSHELRTPLNSILGFSDILQSCSFGEINDMQAEYLSYISKSGEHLLNVINNILDLSKIEAGKMKLNYEMFFISEVFDEIIMTLEPLAVKKNIELTISSEMPTGNIEADRTKFKEIFYNLVSNAIKFTPEKGKVDIDLTKVNDMLYIKVKDTGIGIATEDMDKLFHPFRQLNPYMNHEYEGTGLGLAITKKYIEMHGGNISVKSKVGEGSVFIFSIPLKLNM